MTKAAQQEWADARWRFIEAGGRTTQSFGLGRMIGQIYTILYLSPSPLCLNDIAKGLAVSKASVSIGVRQLEGWLAVRKVWIKGDRKDYYEAETDFGRILRGGFLDSVSKKLETAGAQLDMIEASMGQAMEAAGPREDNPMRRVSQRLRNARKFHGKISGLLNNPLVKKLL